MDKVLYSSKSEEWETPQELFDDLDRHFHFTLDPCATHENHKCDRYFTKEQNGLMQAWGDETVFCNPPYGREIGKWVEKCCKCFGTAVMLLPARTDTKWFHDYCLPYGEVIFLKGRLKFGGAKNSAPFPSMIVIF